MLPGDPLAYFLDIVLPILHVLPPGFENIPYRIPLQVVFLIFILRPEWEEIAGQLYAEWQFGEMGIGEMPMNMDDLIVKPKEAPEEAEPAPENGPEEQALTPPPMLDSEDE